MRALLSARIGADFNRLWTASAISNIGDGVTMAAGPLLVASISDNPSLIAGAVFAQQLPWLLIALVSGAWVDRLDRRTTAVVVNVLRAAALTVLTATIATGTVTIPVVYLVVFLLGVGETLADTAMGALIPAIVAPEHLSSANARLGATFSVNQFIAKPLGAWLFVISAAVPFGVDALTFAASAALLAGIRPVPPSEQHERTSLRREIGAGIRWLWGHRLLRTTAVSMGVGNIAFCAAFAVFVVYCRDRLGLHEVGYGILLTAFAVGGLFGAGVATRLSRRFGNGAVLRAGLITEVLVHVTLAVTTSPWVAAAVLIVFSVHTMVWGVITATIGQRAVPDHLRGRVSSVYLLIQTGGAALGSLLGGLLAGVWSITAPFWIAAVIMALITLGAWRPLREA
ncbi:MFS transporter [Actinoplanes lobatus]|uniref:MFS family permease n=1 Tax=Actinoplanes lobatus TaxID=113568 RepID=A0A7W7MKS7_9ACTN|nr:MFS transporter [Actinoplanes lobatus]MBB4753390.1 MFS family permease [Actinoplanes lobatus]GGN59950.1 MFS transporter [Actinoplanes lobatus]GIE37925.1 MFS transporter [Actinoplanes lobatus]